jgi:hypothetical protein
MSHRQQLRRELLLVASEEDDGRERAGVRRGNDEGVLFGEREGWDGVCRAASETRGGGEATWSRGAEMTPEERVCEDVHCGSELLRILLTPLGEERT